MDTLSILERALSQDQQIDNQELLRGRIATYNDKYTEFENKMENVELVVDDAIGKTWAEIDKHISSLAIKPKVIIIDHIHEIKKSSVQERGMIDEYVRKFKETCVRHDVAGILCAQINRTSQNDDEKRPKLHQLKSSGYLEEFCDVGILLHYPYQLGLSKDINRYDVYIDKNRNGRTGSIRLHFDPATYRFTDWVEEETDKQVKWDDKDHRLHTGSSVYKSY